MNPFMTEEERWAQAIRSGNASPAMTSQTAMSPEQLASLRQATAQTQGERRRLEAQQAMADRLRGTAVPEGRQVGDIYRASSPLEHLGMLAQVAVGQRKANKAAEGYADLDRQESEAALQQAIQKERVRQAQADAIQRRFDVQQANEQSRLEQRLAAEQGMLDQRLGAEQDMLTTRLGADTAAAVADRQARREEGTEGRNYVVDGKVQHIVESATGKFHYGTIEGPEVPNDVMQRAVEYKPGQAEGTLADEINFQMPVEEQGQATPDFMGNLLTSDYFDASTGMFNPTRYLGAAAIGPDGKMIQATQSQMATATLGYMAQRMEEINLRPWTPTEIETISADFPGPNSKYPDWANFTANVMMPMLNAKFAEAITDGRTTPDTQKRVTSQLYGDIIEGARKNGMKLRDLEQLGVPRAVIRKYLESLEEER